MDDSPLSRGPLGLLGSGPLDPSSSSSSSSGDSDSSGGSSSGDLDSSGGSSSSGSPPSPSSSQSPTQSTPPPGSSGSPPSPPSPSLSPPPATPAGTSGSPPGQVSPPGSNAIPSPQAPKHTGGGGGSSESGGGSKGGGGSSGRGKGGSKQDDSPPVAAVVVGVVIGVLAFALLMCIAACVCCARRKKKRPPMAMPFYTDQHGNVYYANNMPNPKWQQSQSGGPPDGHGGVGWHSQYAPGQGPLSEEMMMSGSHSQGTGSSPSPAPAIFGSQSSFTYEELASATGGFSKANLLGQGGFGYVYKGVLPGSGKEVAVKQLKAGSGQGEREFQAEVEIISRVHHRHLVSLVGYCIAGSSQRLLVYEFVANDTLERHLHGKGVPVMDWPKRLAIALGSAKGLAYLHEDCNPRIIHRDIKAANILLDENFEAKVADFGLAKLTTDNNTHVSTRVMGTFGYLAPEYASSGKLTDKSDVFSFGVMMLELITGRRPVDPTNYMEDSLVDWARPLLARALSEGGNLDEVVDPRLENKYDRLEMERMAASAAAAVRHSAKRRPKMKQIVRALEGDASLDDLNEGMKPGQSMIYSSDESGNYAANINRLRQVAFESSEEYTNEYSE